MPQYLIRAKIFPLNALHSNYKLQRHVLATKLPSAGHLCEKYKRKTYTCNLHTVKND